MKIESITLHHISMPVVSGKDIIAANDFQQRMKGIRGHYLVKAGVESYLRDRYNRFKIKPGREVDETSAVRRACPTVRSLKLDDENGEAKIE